MSDRVVIPFGARYLVLDEHAFQAALTAGDAYVGGVATVADVAASELVDANEIAKRFGLKAARVLSLARDGAIPAVKINRLVRFDVSAVRLALDKMMEKR
jgi:hypothetical protein